MPAFEASGLQGPLNSVLHIQLAADIGPELPAPPRPARRHHPDPDPAGPERRLDRRPVPDRRPRRSSCSRRCCGRRRDASARSTRRRPGAILGAGRDAAPARHAGRRSTTTGSPSAAGNRPQRRRWTRPLALERPLMLGGERHGPGLARARAAAARRGGVAHGRASPSGDCAPPARSASGRWRPASHRDPGPDATLAARARPPPPVRPPRAQPRRSRPCGSARSSACSATG